MKKQYTLSLTLLFSLFFLQNTFCQLTQIGIDIDGTANGDRFGRTVDLNTSGNIFVAGAPYKDSNGEDSGQVRVFENVSGTWVQLGQDINGVAAFDFEGHGISISGAGDRIAVGGPGNDIAGDLTGHVRVFEYESNIWNQIGQDIFGTGIENSLGKAIALSTDGSTMAVGARLNGVNGTYAGQVRIFRFESDMWVPLGNVLYGSGSGRFFGTTVNLSSDGNIIAISEHGGDGAITVLQYDGADWQQLGEPILGPPGNFNWGEGATLSDDGSTVAGLSYRNVNGVPGIVGSVYRFDGTSWNTIGSEIEGDGYSDGNLDNSIDINSAGNVIAIGRYGSNNPIDQSPGSITISQNINDQWVQVGDHIEGENPNDFAGFAVSLNAMGDILAIGAPHNNNNGGSSGQVRVFRTEDLGVNEYADTSGFALFPNPVHDILNIANTNQQVIESLAVYTILGQKILFQPGSDQSTLLLDLSTIQAGYYFVYITTNNDISTQRFIKQ